MKTNIGDEAIAERVLFAIDKNGREFNIGLKIGKPYQISPTEWACALAIIGLHGTLRDMHGADSWQSLRLAQGLMQLFLTFFVNDGGRLFLEKDGQEITVDDLFLISKTDLTEEQPEPMGPLSDEQQARVDQLTTEELQKIDNALMAEASVQFRKVARIVGFGMMKDELSFKGIPDIFYASRVKKLVEEGRLISQGNLDYMRFSEVKLPD